MPGSLLSARAAGTGQDNNALSGSAYVAAAPGSEPAPLARRISQSAGSRLSRGATRYPTAPFGMGARAANPDGSRSGGTCKMHPIEIEGGEARLTSHDAGCSLVER